MNKNQKQLIIKIIVVSILTIILSLESILLLFPILGTNGIIGLLLFCMGYKLSTKPIK